MQVRPDVACCTFCSGVLPHQMSEEHVCALEAGCLTALPLHFCTVLPVNSVSTMKTLSGQLVE